MNGTLNETDVFLAAIEIDDPKSRDAYLDAACAGDDKFRQRVEALVRQHLESEGVLDAPPPGLVATIELPTIDEEAGTVIGPYKLLQQIGEGGMGVVFMAEQTEPIERTVALKIIKPGMDTRQVIARFEAERQALALMDHPNIARVLDAGTTDTGRPYFVMDLVKGVPITDYCDRQHLSVRQRLELMTQVCQAVQHAHQKGIIHRDIKPSNVLVAEYDGKPVPKVIDFGVAKATAQKLTERTMFTQYGQIVGTFEYMSPEQARFNQLDVDTRSDIYSLGVLLYEVLAGSTPLEKERLRSAAFDEVLRIICEEEPPRPSTRLSSSQSLPSIAANRSLEPKKLSGLVRGELDWIVMKCLEKDRNRRYETASSLAMDLQRYFNDEPIEARPASHTYRLKKFIRRNRVGVLAGSAIAVALIVGLALASVGFLQARRQAEIAHTEAVRADRAAVRATAVSDFLQDMLQSANPDELKGQEYTLRQLLGDFSAGLSDQLASQPEVEADLQKTIGLAYLRLDNHRSEQHLRRAMELRLSLVGEQHKEFADSLVDYAYALSEQGRPADSEPFLRRALAVYRNQETRGKTVIRALQILQIVLQRQNRLAEIEPVVDQAVAMANQTPEEQFPEIANIYHGLIIAKIEESKFADAEALGRKCVELHLQLHGQNHPETGWGYYNLGRALAASHKFAEAFESFQQAAAVFRRVLPPGNGHTAVTLLGVTGALQLAGKSDRLIELFESPSELDKLETLYRESLPENADLSHAGLANVAMEVRSGLAVLTDIHMQLNAAFAAAGKTAEAEECLAKAQSLREELRLLGLRMAEHVAKQAVDRVAQAAEQLAEASERVRRSPNDSHARLTRAQLRTELKQWNEAMEDLEQASALTKENDKLLREKIAVAYKELCSASFNQHENDIVEIAARKAIELQPDYGDAHLWLGIALSNLGNHEDAITAYHKAIELQPDNFWNYRSLSLALWRDKKFDEAAAACRKAIELEPERSELYGRLGGILIDHAKIEEGFAAINKAIELNPQDAASLNQIAWLLATTPVRDRRDPPRAVELGQKAVELSPQDGNIHNTLGVAQYRAGDWTLAIQALAKSMELRSGGDASDWFFLAMAEWQLDHKDEARTWYDKAVEWMDKNPPKNEELLRFRDEAAELLGITEPQPSADPKATDNGSLNPKP